MLTIENIYWMAGIMEGEGYFGYRPKQIVIQLCMTDKDVIDQFANLCGFGHRKERTLPSGKTAYLWGVTNQAHAAGLMMTLLPLMGTRRSTRIMECLAAWKSRRANGKHLAHCIHGHPLDGDNLRLITEGKYTKRRCITCGVLRQRKHRASKDLQCL